MVLQGQRVDKGMANFSDKLNAADSAAVRAYIVSRANERKNAPPATGRGSAARRPSGWRPAVARRRRAAPTDDIHEEAAGGN